MTRPCTGIRAKLQLVKFPRLLYMESFLTHSLRTGIRAKLQVAEIFNSRAHVEFFPVGRVGQTLADGGFRWL